MASAAWDNRQKSGKCDVLPNKATGEFLFAKQFVFRCVLCYSEKTITPLFKAANKE
jgi:hypothetical protein